jgi:hypothetical protein
MKRYGILLPALGLILISIYLTGCGTATTTPIPTDVAPEPAGTEKPVSIVTIASFTSTPESTATTGPYTLKVSDRYPFFPPTSDTGRLILGSSLAASPGKVWIGSGYGTIEEVDSQSGGFVQSIPIASTIPGSTKTVAGIEMTVFPTLKMAFEGDYLWAWAESIVNGRAHPYLFAIDPDNWSIAHLWDLDSSEWTQNQERLFLPEDFGTSPGKIWIDNHVINTRTFEVTADIYMPGMTQFAFNGMDWMWLTGDTGHGDGLIFINTDNPTQGRYQTRWPFLVHRADGSSGVGPGNPLVLAGDRIWIGKGISGANPTYSLIAYSANMDQLMNETGPLASVPLQDSYQKIKMLYAGNYLWVVYTHGVKPGILCQLDPQTGETLNTLDLIGDEGRSMGDVPQDLATEGDNLWVLTVRQLLRIKLP